MSRNAKKYIVVLLAACLCAAALTLNAFAETGSSSESSSESSPSDSAVTSPADPPEESETPGGGTDVSSGAAEEISVTLDYNNGTPRKVVTVAPGTQVKSLPVPKWKGHSFECWIMNSAEVAPSFEIYSEITLTAQWTAAEESSRKPSSYTSVDTHEREIEQAASRAEEAIRDPDALSSQDWNSLLSTGSQADAGAALQPSSETPPQTPQGGGSSWLFPVGIGLIVLSACGIGAFVYLQFFSSPGSGSHGPGTGRGGFEAMEFTDISSHSGEAETGSAGAPAEPDDASPLEETETARPARADIRNLHAARFQSGLPKAQAKPVDGGKDFDWDKFFNDDF